MKDIVRKCAEIIPPAWQYPDIACTRIRFNEQVCCSPGFKETPWFQEAEIISNMLPAGKVEVFYTEEMPKEQEGPFLKEERFLINSIAEMLGNFAERKNAEETLKRSNEDIRELNAHLQIVREEERTRIAREIHDELGQQLTGLKMHLALFTKKVKAGETAIEDDLRDINSLIDGTVGTVKRIAGELRPGILDDLGLMAAMEWQAREFEKRTGIQCDFSCTPGETLIRKEIATTVFRIYQESLTNVMRYAAASRVQSKLESSESEIKLTVKDNGKGFEMDQIVDKKTLGLLGMQERAYTFGGKLRIDSQIGKGTTIFLSLPLTVHHKKIIS
jgi:signal transduction histidine kinase